MGVGKGISFTPSGMLALLPSISSLPGTPLSTHLSLPHSLYLSPPLSAPLHPSLPLSTPLFTSSSPPLSTPLHPLFTSFSLPLSHSLQRMPHSHSCWSTTQSSHLLPL